MRNLLTISLFISIVLFHSEKGSGQIRVMSYNLLNFPTGNYQGRVDTLRNIIDYYQPHLFMIQELKTAQGLADVTSMMNELEYGEFSSSTFIPQQSNQGTSFPLQQALVFDNSKFGLSQESLIQTETRDINHFKLFLRTVDLENNADTIFLHVFVTHLKSSQGADNEALRLEMINQFNSYLAANMSTTDLILFCGDFNLYSNQEPAYAAMTDNSNSVYMVDPLADLGNWNSSTFPFKEILTQSTRTSQLMSDGAGGGIDDRFDFIVFSPSMFSSISPISYLENSYKSLGNTGNCYNQNITACDDDNAVPFDVLRSMYYMSDHLPQVCELALQVELSTIPVSKDSPKVMFCSSNISFSKEICVRMFSNRNINGSYRILNSFGQLVDSEKVQLSNNGEAFFINSEHFVSGLYFLEIYEGLSRISVQRFVVHH